MRHPLVDDLLAVDGVAAQSASRSMLWPKLFPYRQHSTPPREALLARRADGHRRHEPASKEDSLAGKRSGEHLCGK